MREQQLVLPARMRQGGLRWCPGRGQSLGSSETLQLGDKVRSGLSCARWGSPGSSYLSDDLSEAVSIRDPGHTGLATFGGKQDRVLLGTHPAKPLPTIPGWPQGKGHRKDPDMGSPSPEPNPGSIRDSRE